MYYAVFLPLKTGEPSIFWAPDGSIASYQNQNVQYDNAINLVSTVVTGIKAIHNDYESISTSTINQLELMLPDTIDPIKLQNEVRNIADEAGVGVSDITVIIDPKNTNPNVGAYLVTFNAKGRYPVIKNIVEAIERNKRFYTVEVMTINKVTSKGLSQEELATFDKEALSANLSYKVYYLK
jgi:hypothetical protein